MPITLTRDAVTLYDVELNRVWKRMSHRYAEEDLRICRELGDALQEYDTTDREGRPVRVVLQMDTKPLYGHDAGAVYVFER